MMALFAPLRLFHSARLSRRRTCRRLLENGRGAACSVSFCTVRPATAPCCLRHFCLTVFVDLSIAIAAGVVLASLVSRTTWRASPKPRLLPAVQDDIDEFVSPNRHVRWRAKLPAGVETFRLSGPFFFAVAAEFEDLLSRSGGYPKVLILRMAGVPLIDARGLRR